MFDRLKSVIKTEEIEFLCDPQDTDVIPKPYPANQLMPDWFKYLPAKIDKKNTIQNSTIKRCAPFLDAMTMGWILPLAADVEFITNEDASGVSYKTMFYKLMVENHGYDQVSTEKYPNPEMPKPPMKFMNYWAIKVPKGYSCLFIPPMNRPDPRFQCIAGVVDVDGYFEFINFPFYFNQSRFTGHLKAGTPLVQVIPFRRDAILKKNSIGTMSQEDLEEMQKTRRKKQSHESHYRDNVWEKK